MFKAASLFKANLLSAAPVVVNQGGTSSGKTFAILQVLFCLAIENAKQVITVVGQDIPNLKAGAMRDAQNIYNDSPVLKQHIKGFNKTDRIFEFHNGSLIEFKSYDNGQDARSGKRDYLFVNEANGIDYPVYLELALRTAKRIFIDYNPTNTFWVHEHVIGKDGAELIISDHRHNPFTGEAMRHKIESLKKQDEGLWKVYARGLTGKLRGLIFTNWETCAAIPGDATFVAYGLDFGFSIDQTGLIEVYKQNGELWINELVYETGLTNQDTSRRLQQLGINRQRQIIADSAEPKAIEELRRLGWNVIPATKGADSVKNSIDILKRFKLNITQTSTNLRKELLRYQWKTDSSGNALNQPVGGWDHLIDPLRYVALKKLKAGGFGKTRSYLPDLSPDEVHGDLRRFFT